MTLPQALPATHATLQPTLPICDSVPQQGCKTFAEPTQQQAKDFTTKHNSILAPKKRCRIRSKITRHSLGSKADGPPTAESGVSEVKLLVEECAIEAGVDRDKLPKDAVLVDVGCGSGNSTIALSAAFK